MSYIGNEPNVGTFIVGVERFNGTGSCTQFTLTQTGIQDSNAIEVLVNSIQQDPTNSYSVANGVITFTEAPSTGANNIIVTYRATTVITYGNVGTSQILDGAVTASKIASGVLPSAAANSAGVYANSAFSTANSAGAYANAAFTAANTGGSGATYANSAFLQANTPSYVANSAASYANSGFATANSASIYANGAFTSANSKAATASPTFTGTVVMANANTTVINVQNQLAVFGMAYQNIVTLTDATTITMNLAQTNNFTVTLGGNRTLANATNFVAGQSGFLVVRQDGTGSRTLSFGTGWRFPSNTAPTLTTTASAVDLIAFTARDSGNLVAQAILSVT